MYGELLPVGGGDPIPLLKKNLRIGRRESCDIVLRFSNVSAHHCTLAIRSGYWFVTDTGSTNGTKINGRRVVEGRIDPGDELAVAKHRYHIKYSPVDLGAVGPPPGDDDDVPDIIMGESLLKRAGLQREEKGSSRYDITKDTGGRFRDRNKPV